LQLRVPEGSKSGAAYTPLVSSFEHHLRSPYKRGPVPDSAVIGSAGGNACGDLVRIALCPGDGRVLEISFDAEGCGATIAAASACASLVDGRPLLEAARVGPGEIVAELGGLSPGKRHAADLACDALHRALSKLWAEAGAPLVAAQEGRTLVAMSGGVDSAAAALLSLGAGRDVVAVTLKLWADRGVDGTRSCCSPEAVLGARALAHSMGLPHLTLDLQERFADAVVGDFVAEHSRGRTPNPCVRCNGLVRFDAMLDLAGRIGAEALVTGHYARIRSDGDGPLLARAADQAKDQSYMLAGLRPELLDRIRFPLGELTKPEVRALAREAGLAVASKPESQDLCFLSGTNRERFLERNGGLVDRPGEIVDRGGRLLGEHSGHRRYTVGQRRGLGVASRHPLYVIATDPRSNRVVVGPRSELAARGIELSPAVLYREGDRVGAVKLRYRSSAIGCRLEAGLEAGKHARLALELAEDAHGIATGQTACLMNGDHVVGFGTIAAAAREPALAARATAAS
jgi:tRNA-uridine 2-sulfurtransferase